MLTGPKSNLAARVVTLLALACLFAGCMDLNADLQNCSPDFGNYLVLRVTFDGTTPVDSNKLVESWGGIGPPTYAKRDSANHWTFKWYLVDSGRTANPNAFRHVGATLKSGVPKIKGTTHEYTINPPPDAPRFPWERRPADARALAATTGQIPGLVVDLGLDPSLGYVLLLSNGAPASLGPVTLTRLRWARVLSHIPLNNLLPGDPIVEGLSWQDAPLSVPTTISPGAPATIVDVPDGQIHSGFLLTRFETLAGPSGSCASQVFTQQPALAPTGQGPALGVGAAVLLTFALLALGANAARRSRQRHLTP